jgi:8-oxo-dGTP pyrophosphatase MutT (NUDIX family)
MQRAAKSTGFALAGSLWYLSTMNSSDFADIESVLRRSLTRRQPRVGSKVGLQQAGVLVPIVLSPGPVSLLLTLRTHHVETHKGQVAFPGGVLDPTDGDVIQTALRETEEEIGISRKGVTVLGTLDDLATPTGFLITPVIGLIRNLPELCVNGEEVAEAFTVPLSFFADPRACVSETLVLEGSKRQIYRFDFGGKTIWGATAIIVRSLLQVLGDQDEATA